MVSIALFGTSADPPHQGHLAILSWLATEFDHVVVWAANNPFKRHQTSLADRFTMLQLIIDQIEVPAGRISLYPDLGHSRTIVTLERARQKWPEADFTLVIGADLVSQLPRWYRAQEIFAQAHILVVPRPGYRLSQDDLIELRQQGAHISLATMPHRFDMSSSQYRQADDRDVLPPVVQAYIDQNNLYPCPEDSREKLSTP
ncbi:putative nicotinate-nucleotide adenylyltransferase [Halomicronema hongdechloris C2206]|uniref:Probable nicotinate-nucleotide adenylyltransferase n=1 Tax=Halomicronema hongdechloris C2206 TaxID=1641165 RepID=A0A1Z3HQV8_9CYAN|nr:nicotinate-nucleotide adenylyltransferase [Halomicronema hongdechloris]ASC72675.1 putative nicotinate-nucleotide adenylyltransferase [Halomicronema hongdechloris C2206]